MCKSVPQIDAVFTRTKTSAAPIAGTGALSNDNPRPALIFRKAFIVAAIYSNPRLRTIFDASTARTTGHALLPALSTGQPCLQFRISRSEFRPDLGLTEQSPPKPTHSSAAPSRPPTRPLKSSPPPKLQTPPALHALKPPQSKSR